MVSRTENRNRVGVPDTQTIILPIYFRNGTCFVAQSGVDIDTVKPQYSFLFEFEEKFDKDANRLWMHQNWHTSFYWAALYVSLVFGIKW